MIILEFLFWTSVALILWSYVGYPLFLSILAPSKKRIPAELTDFPDVDILFAAYNEESVIEGKIHSIFKSSYPLEKLHVYIGSDASTDQTDEMVKNLQSTYPQIHLERMPGRTGKSGIINHLYEISSSPLVLGTDANIYFTEDMILHLVQHLQDGADLVGGNIVYRDARNEGIAPEENMYLSFENKLKQRESDLWQAVIGVEGGCYCIKREAFNTIPPLTFMEDFFLTMAVFKKGGKVRFEENAVCTEDVSVDRQEEFKRKVRISLGNFQNLNRFWTLIFTRFWPIGFAFFSHKILRWCTPILLITTLLSSLAISVLSTNLLYLILLGGQLFLLILFIINQLLPGEKKRSSALRFVGHFYLMNFALLKGLMIYLQGVDTNVWQPTKRAQKRT